MAEDETTSLLPHSSQLPHGSCATYSTTNNPGHRSGNCKSWAHGNHRSDALLSGSRECVHDSFESFGKSQFYRSSASELLPNTQDNVQHDRFEGDGCLNNRHVYPSRWYILFLYSLAMTVAFLGWAMWGPISLFLGDVYRWKSKSIAFQENWTNVGYIFLSLPWQYLQETYGLRRTMVASCFFCALGTCLWGLLLVQNLRNYFTIIFHGGAILLTIGSTFLNIIPASLSAAWFPANQWSVSTTIATNAGILGSAISYILGPNLVIWRGLWHPTNGHPSANHSSLHNHTGTWTNSIHGFSYLIFIEMGLMCVCLLLVCIYFPNGPPSPPSESAATDRLDLKAGLRALLRKKDFWLANIAYNLPTSIAISWAPLLSQSLDALNLSETTSGWVGFSSSMGGFILSVFSSSFVDRFKRRMKLSLLCLVCGSSTAYVLLLCLLKHYITIESRQALLGCIIFLQVFGTSTAVIAQPLYYELACEVAYPVHEGLVVSVLCVTGAFVSVGFYLVFLLPIEAGWMIWAVAGSFVISIPILVLTSANYRRLAVEETALPDELRSGSVTS